MESGDPWRTSFGFKTIGNQCDKFEDDFTVPLNSDRLPDSAEYLASLEKKLAKIKSGKGRNKTEGKDLIQSLEESNNSCMYRLIAGDSYSVTEQDLLLEAPTSLSESTKWLRAQVNPEQALTVGELVELVKADYLAQQQELNDSDPAEKTE